MNAVTSAPELKAVFAQAQRIGAALREPVGPRELLLAAATVHPNVVVATARARGIEVRRLMWAMREWGPIDPVGPALVSDVDVTPAARAVMAEAARSGDGRAHQVLVERLLDPTLLDAGKGEPGASDPAPDATAMVLSRLRLI